MLRLFRQGLDRTHGVLAYTPRSIVGARRSILRQRRPILRQMMREHPRETRSASGTTTDDVRSRTVAGL